MKEDVISISLENTKMGPIPSFSITPGITCAEGCECWKNGCYARRMCQRFKPVRDSWTKNYVIAQNTGLFMSQTNGWLAILRPAAFRIHVGGDFFSDRYFNAWCEIAKENKTTKFFAFTKQFDILRKCQKNIPKNLSIILSAWIPYTDNWIPPEDLMRKFPVAWVFKDANHLDAIYYWTHNHNVGGHTYEKIEHCSGHCAECGKCFNLKRKDGDILFEYH